MLIAWIVASMVSRPTIQEQDSPSRFLQIFIQVIGLWMIFGLPFRRRGDALAHPLLPRTSNMAIFGLCLTLASMLLCVWARILLGRNRSGVDRLNQNRELLRKGPYRVVRHPVYAGVILAMLGTAIVFSRAECFVGVLLVAFGFLLRVRLEDRFMRKKFGEEYARYRKQVRALIPFIF